MAHAADLPGVAGFGPVSTHPGSRRDTPGCRRDPAATGRRPTRRGRTGQCADRS